MTREESQAQTRARVLEGAARVFARRGYHGASISDIAEEAGYSHGAVYSNFKDKKDLFLALYEDWVAQRVAEIDAGRLQWSTLADGTRAMVDEWLQRFARDPDPFVLRLEFAARGARDPDLQRKLGTRVGAVPLALQRLVDGAAGENELSLPAEEVALALQALSLGLALESLSNPDAVRPGLGGDLAALLIEALTVRDRSVAP